MDLVAAARLVLEDHRQLADVDVALLQVVLAGHRAQVQHLEVLGQRHDDAVEVGELVARGVDRPVVRVALHDPGRAVDRLHRLERAEHRQLGIERPVLLEVQARDPVVVALGLRRGVRRVDAALHVLRQELLEVVGRGVGAVAALVRLADGLAAADQRVAGHQVLEQVERHVELEVHREVVHLDDAPGLALRRHVGDRRRDDVLVAVDVLEPEDEVVRGHRRAVGPAQAAAQVEREGLAVVAHLPSLREGRVRLGAGVVDEDRAVGGVDAVAVLVVARAREAAAPDAAVLPGLLHRLDDHQVLRKAVLHRGQLALPHELGQLGRLVEGLRPLGLVGDDRDAFRLAYEPGLRQRALGLRLERGQQRDREGRAQREARQELPARFHASSLSRRPGGRPVRRE